MTCIYFPCGGPLRVCIYLPPNDLPSLPRTSPPRVPARSYGQAGGPREAAGGGRGKAGAKGGRRAGKGAVADGNRWPRLSVTNCAEFARKFPEFEAKRR